MIVKKGEHKRREFRGVGFLVGATGERMMVTLMQFKRGDRVGRHRHKNEQAGYCFSGRFKLTDEPVNFFIDTGGAELTVDREFAEELGIQVFGWEPVTEDLKLGHCRAERIKLGKLLVKNVPVHILDIRQFSEPVFGGLRVDGIIGTVFLYHFLATLDYPKGELILRRRTAEAMRSFEKEAVEVPFWMAEDHFIVAWGTINGSRPMLFFVDTGLAGKAFMAPKTTLKEVGITPDESKATEGVTIFGKIKEIPFAIEELTLGEAKERGLEGVTDGFQVEDVFGFRIGGLISHQFFRSYALTLDFADMRLFLIRHDRAP